MTTPEDRGATAIDAAAAFRQAGWAFVFLGLSAGPTVRLGHEAFVIDLLPDFVGYLLIATAANRLGPLDRRARTVRTLALVLTCLTIPTVVQYTVTTSQAGGMTTWTAPLWPLAVAQGLLDLVLVWVLCGLVAALARRAGDRATERQAAIRRVAYVGLRLLLTGGVALAVLAPNRDLILTGVFVGVALGLLTLALMMGLMRRAARMCEDRPEVVPPAADARPGGSGFRLLVLAAVLLPVGLGAGAYWYYQEWEEARVKARVASSSAYGPARDAFYADLLAGRIDDAYESTTADFRARISRAEFADLAARYVAFVNRPRAADRGGGVSTSSGSDRLTETRYAEVEPGRVIQVTITVRRDRDSILVRTPPPLKVDDFQVEERAAPDRPGLPLGPGR